ncbi:MAG TPA: VOC family protein [Methylomirabilota bacterium]|nr:VOC family protein [Methylomirabilota bacterium]
MRAESAIAGIDHALVGVRDLEAARAAWVALGFTVTPRGRHIGWATGNYCIMFDRGYVELLGIVDPAGFTNDLDRFLAEREGLLGIALRSTDSERTARWLAAAGLTPAGPKDLKRALELPEGTVMPAFKLVSVPPATTPGLKAFFCQHLTPELIRRPAWVVHANRAIALQAVVTVAERPGDLAAAYARLFGDGAVQGTADSLAVDTGEGNLLFVTAVELGRLYPGIALPSIAPPWIAALRIGVPSIAETADYLDEKGVRTLPTGRGIAVPPALANGAVVEFVPA